MQSTINNIFREEKVGATAVSHGLQVGNGLQLRVHKYILLGFLASLNPHPHDQGTQDQTLNVVTPEHKGNRCTLKVFLL
jgi:hypothetical protein